MKAGGVAGKVGRPGATALVLSLPAALAGREHVASDVPRGWNLALAVCFVVVEAWLRVLALRTPQLP